MRLEAVIFDWAGTTVDHGSLAPVRALTELFDRYGIRLEDSDVRRDMGLFKKDHIRSILKLPEVRLAWIAQMGRGPEEHDVERLFGEFTLVQMDILKRHSEVIAGVAYISEHIRGMGLRIGGTTGYTRPMLDLLIQEAAFQGYCPEASVCPDDVGGGRPYPWMCLEIAMRFRLTSVASAVKVGDTLSDIQEGLNAGMWTVGVSETGNEIGLSAADLGALPNDERKRRSARAAERLQAAGAHYVIENVKLILPVLESIDRKLAAGERP